MKLTHQKDQQVLLGDDPLFKQGLDQAYIFILLDFYQRVNIRRIDIRQVL